MGFSYCTCKLNDTDIYGKRRSNDLVPHLLLPPPPCRCVSARSRAGWEAKEAGGRVVYINHITQKTQWERPAVADEIPPPGITRAPAGTSPMDQPRDMAVAEMAARAPTNPTEEALPTGGLIEKLSPGGQGRGGGRECSLVGVVV